MSETLIDTEFITPQHHIETTDEAMQRIADTIRITPYDPNLPGKEEQMTAIYIGTPLSAGVDLYRPMAPPKEDDYDSVDLTDEANADMFDAVAQKARNDAGLLRGLAKAEGDWWSGSLSGEIVTKQTREVFRIHEGEKHIDFVNATTDDLTDDQVASIQKVMNAVAHYTGNKIFDRVNGIVLVPHSAMGDEVAGGFQAAFGIVRIDASVLDDPEVLGRYANYFKEGTTNFFEIDLAHELGHAMDIHDLNEVDAHGINKDNFAWSAMWNKTVDFSAFNDRVGWGHHIENGKDGQKVNVHHMDEAQEIELRENAPTSYALQSPDEDFAESFAIAVLEGDTSAIKSREQLIGQTVLLALGENQIGPKNVLVAKIDPSQMKTPAETVALRLLVHKSAK